MKQKTPEEMMAALERQFRRDFCLVEEIVRIGFESDDQKIRLQAYTAALPYLHAQLKSVEHKIDNSSLTLIAAMQQGRARAKMQVDDAGAAD